MERISIGIGLDVSDLVSNAERAKSSLESLNRATDVSIKTGNIEDVKTYTAANIEARKQFNRDARVGGYFDKATLDSGELQEQIQEIEEAMRQKFVEGNSREARELSSVLTNIRSQLTSELVNSRSDNFEDTIRQAVNSGDMNTVHSQLDKRKQYIRDARIGGDTKIKLDSGPLETIMRELKDAINRSISEGKPDEAKRYGSILKDFQKQIDYEQGGDDQKKKELEQLRLMRNLARFTNAQNIIGSAGGGNIAGAALGVAGGTTDLAAVIKGIPAPVLAGAAVATAVIGLGATANKLSEQWEKVMQPSMGLAASLGRLGDDADKNHAAFQEVFARATDKRALHGYKLEEGIELANRLSKSGLSEDSAIGGEEAVFRYQRMTDADRGTLAQAVGYAGRYRDNENVLGYAFGGAKASGMERGQYQEYLNATLRIFEEGLSKGVVKGFAEITKAQNMLAFLGETWKGEQGAQRILRMEDAITGAGELQSDYDVIMYRAAQGMMKDDKSLGDSGNYLDVASVLDQGITAGDGKILQYVHEVIEGMASTADEQALLYKRIFSLNADAARRLQSALAGGELKDAAAVFEDPNSKGVDGTPEGKLLSATEDIRGNVAKMGEWFTGPKANIVDAISRLTGAMAGDKIFEYHKENSMESLESLGLANDETNRMDRLFQQAYTRKNQPDANNNFLRDWGENAGNIQDMFANLPIGVKYRIANDKRLQRALFSRFQKVEDFTPENVAAFEETLKGADPMSDGGTEEDTEKKIREMAQRRSIIEENEKNVLPNFLPSSSFPMIQSELYTKAYDDTKESQEYKDFREIMEGNHPEITAEILQEIAAPHLKAETEDMGYISKGEFGQIVQALRELIPALKEANTFIFEQRDP
jgi:hypothetical protein